MQIKFCLIPDVHANSPLPPDVRSTCSHNYNRPMAGHDAQCQTMFRQTNDTWFENQSSQPCTQLQFYMSVALQIFKYEETDVKIMKIVSPNRDLISAVVSGQSSYR